MKDICIGRKYTNRDGEEKTAWSKIGILGEKEGRVWLKLELIPVGWDGFASVFEQKPKQQKGSSMDDMQDSDIPF